jgi:DNA polymerase V
MITPKDSGVSIHSGFPNAGTDTSLTALDITKLLVRNPSSTFFMRVAGENAEGQGVFDGDIVAIDRSLHPTPGDRVIWWSGEGFAICRLNRLPEGTQWWGVVTCVIHKFRDPRV